MATTTDLTTLKINYLSQSQYDNALANNQINSDELYFTPADEGVTINLNGQNVQSPSFYAPTGGGTADTQALVSGGTAIAPKWVDISPSITVTAGTSSATPKVNVTVLGQSGTAQSITTATTGAYGATKLTNTYTSTDETLATTGKSILAAIQTLDVTAITGAANKTITSISETDGKISATYSDIGSLNASTITSGTLPTARGGTGATSYRINSVIVGSATPTETGGTVASQLTWVQSKSGALYSTGTNEPTQFGTLPVAQGGTGNTSQTANRLIYSESATKLSSSGHYASLEKVAINSTAAPTENFYVNGTTCLNGSLTYNYGTANRLMYTDSNKIVLAGNHYVNNTKVAIYSTTEPTENFYVNGTSRFALGTGSSDDLTSTKKFLVGSSGKRYLSIGGAGFQAYDENDAVSILHLNYNGGSVRVNYGVSSSNANSELLVKGRVVVDTSYHNTNSFSEFRINRSTGGWSAITLGGAQGTVSGAGLGVWLIGNKDTPANATTAAASITDSQFYISYNGSNSAACRIQGHNADGFSIRPRLAVNTNVNTDYNFYVNGTSLFFGKVVANVAAQDAISVQHGTANKDAGFKAYRTDTGTAIWMGVGSGGTNHGLYSLKLNKWMIYADASSVTVNGNAQNVTGTVAIENGGTGATTAAAARTNLGFGAVTNSGTAKHIAYYSAAGTISSSDAYINHIAGTASAAGDNEMVLGNSTATGTAGNAHGRLSLYSDGTKGTVLQSATNSTAWRTITLPAFTGNAVVVQSPARTTQDSEHWTLAASDWREGVAVANRYYVPLTQEGGAAYLTDVIHVHARFFNDTTNEGYAGLVFGNNIPSGTAGNTYGFLRMYSKQSYYHTIYGHAATGNRSHYLPDSTGWIATGGNGTSTGVGSATQPVYLSSAGVLTACNGGSMVQSQYLVREGTGTTSYSMTFNFAPDIIISLTSGSTDFMIDSYQGILVSGAYNFNNNIVFMRFVPTGTYQSALSNTAEDYTTGDFFSGIQFAPPMIKSGLFANYFPYYVNNGTFTFNPSENSGGVLHQKSSNGKTYYLKAVSNTTGVAYAQTILNSSGVKYAFLALKFM